MRNEAAEMSCVISCEGALRYAMTFHRSCQKDLTLSFPLVLLSEPTTVFTHHLSEPVFRQICALIRKKGDRSVDLVTLVPPTGPREISLHCQTGDTGLMMILSALKREHNQHTRYNDTVLLTWSALEPLLALHPNYRHLECREYEQPVFGLTGLS